MGRIKNDRITIEALKYYVPLFKIGDSATTELLNVNLTPSERNFLETKARLRTLTVKKIADLSGPLMTREINKLINYSHLKNREDLYTILYYSGLNGMEKGLRNFEVEKINKSSTNYLFQWIVTYAKKELSVIEAPFGIAPSRFQRYKKISAVRKRLSEKIGRYADNQEVLDFFKSGQADIKNMQGRVGSSDKPSQANLNMTLEIIEEQEEFELNLSSVNLLDPLEDYSAEAQFSKNDYTPFYETIFGVFLESENFNDEAKAVLMSELKAEETDLLYENLLFNLDQKEYKIIVSCWKSLLKDINGPFYNFLLSVKDDEFDQFDIGQTLSNIENYNKKINSKRYKILFVQGEE